MQVKVKCKTCGKKFDKRGIRKHIHYKHAIETPVIGEVDVAETETEQDRVIGRLLDILWGSLSTDQKLQAVNSLQLDED